MSLSSTYQSRKNLLAQNLTAMGVTASGSEGLTSLIDKVTDIAPSVGGITPVVSIDISKTPSTGTIYEGDTVLITCKVNADYDDESVADIDLHGYLQGATLTIKNSGSTLGTCVSDTNGIATYTISNIAVGSYSITAHFDGTGTDYESATSSALTFTVKNNTYLFYDEASSENLSQYTVTGGNFIYDSTEQAYALEKIGTGHSRAKITLQSNLPTKWELNANVKSGVGTNVQPAISVGDLVFRCDKNGNAIDICDYNITARLIGSSYTISTETWYHFKIQYDNGSITYSLYDSTATTQLATVSYSHTITSTDFELVSGYYNCINKFKNITIETRS